MNHLKILACVLAVAGCTSGEPPSEVSEPEQGRPQAYTVNYPLAYFAEGIAGDKFDVVFPAPADVDPAFWSPSADSVADYQRADVILLNGAGYAKWAQRVTLPQSRLVDTSAALADRLIPLQDTVTHTHGPSGDHSHAGTAFTTWLDMSLAATQARAVFDALVLLRPEFQSEFLEGLNALERDLAALDDRMKDLSERIGDQPLVFSHPVYQYLIRGYGLNGRSVHWEPDETPSDHQWDELAGLLDEHAATLMIWEGEPLQATVSRLEDMGVQSVVFSPSANRPEEGSFVTVIDGNVAALEQAFPPSSGHSEKMAAGVAKTHSMPKEHSAVHWGYGEDDGPENWAALGHAYALCDSGRQQSPIDLTAAVAAEPLGASRDYRPATLKIIRHAHVVDVIDNSHTIQVNYDEGSTIVVDDKTYELKQYHFHAPSEHTVEGRHFPMEMHLVHQSAQGKLAVLGVLISEGRHNAAFEPVWSNLPDEVGEEIHHESVTVNIDDLLPAKHLAYRYSGSLTTPPCSEGVSWFVAVDPIELSTKQIAEFTAIFQDNNRPVQSLNDRTVFVQSVDE